MVITNMHKNSGLTHFNLFTLLLGQMYSLVSIYNTLTTQSREISVCKLKFSITLEVKIMTWNLGNINILKESPSSFCLFFLFL